MRESSSRPPAEQQAADIGAVLRKADARQVGRGMPLGARNRVAMALEQHGRERHASWVRWLPAVSFIAGAVLALAALGVRWPPAPAISAARPAMLVGFALPPSLGPFRVMGEGCEVDTGARAFALEARCRLVARHLSVEVWERAMFEVDGRTLDVKTGRMLFDVQPVLDRSDPVSVNVSHGRIEVIGTRFAVEQSATGGHVDLLEGEIRFHESDGAVVEVLPGQRHAWGDEAAMRFDVESELESVEEQAPAEEVEPQGRPRRARSAVSAAAAARVIERVTELRAEHRFGAAISVLRRALRRPWSRRTAQVLSYELGELLRSDEDIEGACQHFLAHQRTYPRGRYWSAVERTLRRLRCD